MKKGYHMKNIFIEGIQGMGKSTLLQEVASQKPEYRVCREGDYSPVELAWCAWMNREEYENILERYSFIRKEIEENTTIEENHYVVTYTKIITDIPGFHKDLEQYEIYNGRKSLSDFEQIISSRYQRFCETGYVFECSFLQNIVEDLILFHQLSDDEIVSFYHRLYRTISKEDFLLFYLYSDKIEESIRIIQKERSDDKGNQLWYPVMLEYLENSPYGKQHHYQGFEDMVEHFKHRQQVELRIIHEVLENRAVILPAKKWDRDKIWNYCQDCSII